MSEPVSNTSPLYDLQKAGVLNILPRIYRTIVIPQAVRDELDAGRRRGSTCQTLKNCHGSGSVTPTSIRPSRGSSWVTVSRRCCPSPIPSRTLW